VSAYLTFSRGTVLRSSTWPTLTIGTRRTSDVVVGAGAVPRAYRSRADLRARLAPRSHGRRLGHPLGTTARPRTCSHPHHVDPLSC